MVAALQRAFIDHMAMLRQLGVEAVPVRRPEGLAGLGLDRIIVPGDESTTIGGLVVSYGPLEPLRRTIEAEAGIPVYGTCAGMIVPARARTGRRAPAQ